MHTYTYIHRACMRYTMERNLQSLCAEMFSELRFAVRCGSRQRPASKSRNSSVPVSCGRCSPHATRRRTRYYSSGHEETTYVPSLDIPRLNGVSPVPHKGSTDQRFFFFHFFHEILSFFVPFQTLYHLTWSGYSPFFFVLSFSLSSSLIFYDSLFILNDTFFVPLSLIENKGPCTKRET